MAEKAIARIELDNDRVYEVGDKVKRITRFDMNGQMAHVPWYRVEVYRVPYIDIVEVNGAFVREVKYQG